MSSVNILSGGAAQGLVGSLTSAFKTQTGFEIAGEFGAVGVMADKLRKGAPADIIVLTASLVAKLAGEKLVPGRDRACRSYRRYPSCRQGCG
jgi:molybdate transport system substrate-binding protein